MDNCYTYALYDSNTGLPFYIGKGTTHRMYDHENEARKGTCINKHLMYKILKVKETGYIDYYKIVDNVNSDYAYEIEEQSIAYCKSIGIKLCNLTAGGKGSTGHAEETKLKMSLSKLGSKGNNTGHHWNEESRKNAKTGKYYRSKEHLESLHKNSIIAAELRSIPVCRLIDNKLYKSMKECEIDNNRSSSFIRKHTELFKIMKGN